MPCILISLAKSICDFCIASVCLSFLIIWTVEFWDGAILVVLCLLSCIIWLPLNRVDGHKCSHVWLLKLLQLMCYQVVLEELGMVLCNWFVFYPSSLFCISQLLGRNHEYIILQMHAEFQVLSPLVPVRQVKFLRFCKQHGEGLWAVVDVSIDTALDGASINSFVNCRRLPSGCVVQDLSNGYTRVNY